MGAARSFKAFVTWQRPVYFHYISRIFEVQNRLLQTQDALALTGVDEVEFEALSNDAIIIILEIPGATQSV